MHGRDTDLMSRDHLPLAFSVGGRRRIKGIDQRILMDKIWHPSN